MRKLAYIYIIMGLTMILLGILSWEYIDTKCKEVDPNTTFWAMNCDH